MYENKVESMSMNLRERESMCDIILSMIEYKGRKWGAGSVREGERLEKGIRVSL